MRLRLLTFLILFALIAGVTPAGAEIALVDPNDEPEIILDEADAEKVAILQSAAFPSLESEVSPDDTSILTFVFGPEGPRLAFQDVNTGATTPVQGGWEELGPVSEIAWRDSQHAVWISGNDQVGPILVSILRDTGEVMTETLGLPGFPLSLSPNATRVLVTIPETQQLSRGGMPASPFTLEVKRQPWERVGLTKFDTDRDVLKLSHEPVTIASFDLNSSEVVELATVPAGSGIVSQPRWTRDGSKVAYVRTTVANIGRQGNLLSELVNQDALGNIEPAENPFFQGNVVNVFDIAGRDIRPAGLKAGATDGAIFYDAMWSTDGRSLLTQVQWPATLVGRRYPTYLFPDRSSFRFYDASLNQVSVFDRPELNAPYSTGAYFVSPDEVIFNSPVGMTYRLFYYNRLSGEFRAISSWDGAYYQVRTTHQSRQLIYNYSAFPHPYEIYRIGWDGQGLRALTAYNAEIAELNQVRSDRITFTLRNGAARTGLLVQPPGAPFPPRNVPIVLWQEGGPGPAMINQWGANVENPYNLLPNFGVAVLVLPLSGREGFGPQFYNDLANGRNFGQIDIDEGAQAAEQLIRMGYTSRERLGITGCSYGGYFTSQSITQYPTLYAAANTQCSLLDLVTEWQVGYTPVVSYLEGQPPTVDPAEYTKDSPFFQAAQVQTPLLMFHGTRDFLPIQTAANFHDQVEANGVPVVLLAFQDEGHGLTSPVSQFTAGQAQVAWFQEFLGVPGVDSAWRK